MAHGRLVRFPAGQRRRRLRFVLLNPIAMNTDTTIAPADKKATAGTTGAALANLISFYEEAGPDYFAWSKKFNMHFGFFRFGMNPFLREIMLERMTSEVLSRLFSAKQKMKLLLDLGCGMGASARYAATHFPVEKVIGATVVPWQVKEAAQFTSNESLTDRVNVIDADYSRLPLPASCADGVMAIESMCHSGDCGKQEFIQEMHRVLKSGKRFVIADGFLKKMPGQLNALAGKCYKGIRSNWALDDLAEINLFKSNLECAGFHDVKAEDISWNVAVSMTHVPFVSMNFLLKNLFAGKRLKKRSRDNLYGSLLAMVLGLHRRSFGYFLVSGIKN
jgi:ubiquinone/menaquinone biosynthesis C-methylase UbiE